MPPGIPCGVLWNRCARCAAVAFAWGSPQEDEWVGEQQPLRRRKDEVLAPLQHNIHNHYPVPPHNTPADRQSSATNAARRPTNPPHQTHGPSANAE